MIGLASACVVDSAADSLSFVCDEICSNGWSMLALSVPDVVRCRFLAVHGPHRGRWVAVSQAAIQ